MIIKEVLHLQSIDLWLSEEPYCILIANDNNTGTSDNRVGLEQLFL